MKFVNNCFRPGLICTNRNKYRRAEDDNCADNGEYGRNVVEIDLL